MRFFLRAVTFTSAILVTLCMLAVNIAFEFAGSVPDIDGCGFLAGSLLVLLFLYPALAALVAARTTRFLVSRGSLEPESIVRRGGRIGGLGAGIYFIAGVFGVLAAPHSSGVPPLGWLTGALLTGATFAGGRLGAQAAYNRLVRDGAIASVEMGL